MLLQGNVLIPSAATFEINFKIKFAFAVFSINVIQLCRFSFFQGINSVPFKSLIRDSQARILKLKLIMTKTYELIIVNPSLGSKTFRISALKQLRRNNERIPSAKTVTSKPRQTFSMVLTHGRPSSEMTNCFSFKTIFPRH